MVEIKKKKRNLFVFLLVLLIYLLVGFSFTIFRSNSHYDYFIVQEESLDNNGKSYWDNRCIEENRERPIPQAQWCLDGLGKFHTSKPSRFSWYFIFYSRRIGDFFFLLLFWWLQLFGIELIKFRGVGYYL